MLAAIWTLIALLAGALFWALQYLGSRIDALSSKIDAQGSRLSSKIDGQGSSLSSKIEAQGARLDARIDQLQALLTTHLERHAG
ncbi:MAG: hypothetical protein ABR600_10150 [Actinomycetota bacterium]